MGRHPVDRWLAGPVPTQPPPITGDDVAPADRAVRYELATLRFRLHQADGIEPWARSRG